MNSIKIISFNNIKNQCDQKENIKKLKRKYVLEI